MHAQQPRLPKQLAVDRVLLVPQQHGVNHRVTEFADADLQRAAVPDQRAGVQADEEVGGRDRNLRRRDLDVRWQPVLPKCGGVIGIGAVTVDPLNEWLEESSLERTVTSGSFQCKCGEKFEAYRRILASPATERIDQRYRFSNPSGNATTMDFPTRRRISSTAVSTSSQVMTYG